MIFFIMGLCSSVEVETNLSVNEVNNQDVEKEKQRKVNDQTTEIQSSIKIESVLKREDTQKEKEDDNENNGWWAKNHDK